MILMKRPVMRLLKYEKEKTCLKWIVSFLCCHGNPPSWNSSKEGPRQDCGEAGIGGQLILGYKGKGGGPFVHQVRIVGYRKPITEKWQKYIHTQHDTKYTLTPHTVLIYLTKPRVYWFKYVAEILDNSSFTYTGGYIWKALAKIHNRRVCSQFGKFNPEIKRQY